MANVLGLVSFRVFPTHMGGQKGVAVFYQYLQQQLNVLLICSTDNKDSDKVRMERILFPNKKIYKNIFRIKKLARLIQSNKIEIIVAEHSYTGWIAWLLQKKTGIPFIIHSHNIESKRFQKMNKWLWTPYHWYEGWIHRKAQHNFFISKDDEDFAIKEFHLDALKCSVITYGLDEIVEKKDAKDQLKKILGIDDEAILFFNGTLNYKPNIDAISYLLYKLDPVLQKENFLYKIVITGNQASPFLQKKIAANPRFIYKGFVDDVELYYQGADVFINAVNNDTGIKTKLVEALANNCTVISTRPGATGIPSQLAGAKLIILNSNEPKLMAKAILLNLKRQGQPISEEYLDYFNWNNITAKASEKINQLLYSND